MDFDYEKAYCTLALPAFQALTPKQVKAFNTLLPMVKDLSQDRNLNIPMSAEMTKVLNPLSCGELAEMARASYFVGHWYPSLLPKPFDNTSGESWKVSNVIDQVLRARLTPPHNIYILEGTFRVTYSDENNWIWEEFGLATEKNLEAFKTCGYRFGLDSIEKSADKLKVICGDLWDYDNMPENGIYKQYKVLRIAKRLEDLKKRQADTLKKIKMDIENSKKEFAAFTWLIDHDIDTDNCIYYSHTDIFSFGWRQKISNRDELQTVLKNFPYKWEFHKGDK